VFEQLAEMLTHLGGKRIVVLSIGEYSLRFDLVATITMWAVTLVLVLLALYLRRGLRQEIEEKPNRIQATLDLLIETSAGDVSVHFHVVPVRLALQLGVDDPVRRVSNRERECHLRVGPARPCHVSCACHSHEGRKEVHPWVHRAVSVYAPVEHYRRAGQADITRVSSALNLFFSLLMGGIQAFVFAMLAVAYINVAVES
jgi:hypothetical protein